MSKVKSSTTILWDAYHKFLLPLGGKKVATAYRINIPFQFDRQKYGKSTPEQLVAVVEELASKKGFDLKTGSIEEIRLFMEENQLGLDCSGFAYHLLDHLLTELGKGGMKEAGFPKASRANVKLLTSVEFAVSIDDLNKAQPGDLIKLNSGEDILHCVIVLENNHHMITYAHSSGVTPIKGVHTGKIIEGQLPKDLQVFSYDLSLGDGLKRLKILS